MARKLKLDTDCAYCGYPEGLHAGNCSYEALMADLGWLELIAMAKHLDSSVNGE